MEALDLEKLGEPTLDVLHLWEKELGIWRVTLCIRMLLNYKGYRDVYRE